MIKKGKPFPLGVSNIQDNIQFAISLPNVKECSLHLYQKGVKEKTIVLDRSYQIGSIFSVILEKFPYKEFAYYYEVDGKKVLDPYSRRIIGREQWGKRVEEETIRSGVSFEEFDWEEDTLLNIPYEDTILYQVHVRGFTKHVSSKVKKKGTYEGIIEKIPYLKELGINALLVMPTYEFDEVIKEERKEELNLPYLNYMYEDKKNKSKESKKIEEKQVAKINYWGYSREPYYFAPKTSYAANKKNPVESFKSLVKELHKNGIELILEFYFYPKTNQNLMLDCLRYWVLEYHVDGFRINDDVVPTTFLATDPLLSSVKLLSTNWNQDMIYEEQTVPEQKKIAEFNDGFMVNVRRFLKGDEGQVGAFTNYIKRNPKGYGVINYITKINGFTLSDLVSYDVKHNEANGENGADGTDYNYSWNCGIEGKTRKQTIINLRKKQMKNAMVFLMISQGTPMLLSGDEFCHSANGNNNPYCQDNAISWLNWNQLTHQKEMFSFVKKLISIRKKHSSFHKKKELVGTDYISCGYPDISFHGTKSWYPDFSNYSRVLGILLCGLYEKNGTQPDAFFYIAINMHWEPHEFNLPKLPKELEWELLVYTGEEPIELKKQNIELEQENHNTIKVKQEELEEENINHTNKDYKNQEVKQQIQSNTMQSNEIQSLEKQDINSLSPSPIKGMKTIKEIKTIKIIKERKEKEDLLKEEKKSLQRKEKITSIVGPREIYIYRSKTTINYEKKKK